MPTLALSPALTTVRPSGRWRAPNPNARIAGARMGFTRSVSSSDIATGMIGTSAPTVLVRTRMTIAASKQRNVVEAQNLWNEPRQLLSHDSGRPQRVQLSTLSPLSGSRPSRSGALIILRHSLISHCDVLVAL
jgi:hypothetical protein